MTNHNEKPPLYQLKQINYIDNAEELLKMAKAEYKIKHEKTARSFNNLESIGEEMDKLAKDDTKNEKMGVIFRTISDNIIMDYSVTLRTKPDNTLLNSETLKDYVKQYLEYVKTIEELKGKKYFSDILVHYYPLDLNNKVENISNEDKIIETLYKASSNLDKKYEIINDKTLSKIK